jgi:hypothetical protein
MHLIHNTDNSSARILCRGEIDLLKCEEPITEDFTKVTCDKCLSFEKERFVVVIDKLHYVIEFDGGLYLNSDVRKALLLYKHEVSQIKDQLKDLHKDVLVYKVNYSPTAL